MRNARKRASFNHSTTICLGMVVLLSVLAGCTQEPAAVDRKEQMHYGRKVASTVTQPRHTQEESVITSEPIAAQPQLVSPQRMIGEPASEQQVTAQGQAKPTQTLEEQLANVRSGKQNLQERGDSRAHDINEEQQKQAAKSSAQAEPRREDDIPPELMALHSKGKKQAAEQVATQARGKSQAQIKGGYKTATPMNDPNYAWPAYGQILSRFKHGKNEGLNIALAKGTNIAASADGEVVYVEGGSEEYGKMMIVKHSGNIFTAYAHADKIMVAQGSKVHKGQVIASAGQTGSVSSPQLYFSIRKDDDTIDPEAPL